MPSIQRTIGGSTVFGNDVAAAASFLVGIAAGNATSSCFNRRMVGEQMLIEERFQQENEQTT